MAWLTQFMPGNAPDGAPILSVLGKKTFKFQNGKAAVEDADDPIPFLEADEYWGQGNPQVDPVKLESDLVAYKPMTDVVFLALAHAPKGRPVPMLDVGVQVGTARKIFRVFGDRKVVVTGTGIAFTPPAPFEFMPLDYSLAYGGKDEKSEDGIPYVYPKNPVGKGFVVRNEPKALQDLVLPNLEDPSKLLTPQNLALGKYDRWKIYPDPMGLGYTSKNFWPRYTMAGLPPDHQAAAELERQRALRKMPTVGSGGSGSQPPPPTPILNPRFFNGASPGLSFPYLKGDETLKLANLDKDHPQFAFTLPGVRPRAWLDVGQGKAEMKMVLHTVTVYKPTNQVTLVWRGSCYYGGLEEMKTFTALEYGVEG